MSPLLRALSHFRSLAVTVPLVYLSTVVWGTVSLLVSAFDSTGSIQHLCARGWARTLLLLAGARVTVRGTEHLQPGRTYVFAANHQSYFDIPVAFAYLPANFRIMAKATLFHIPFLGWHLRRSGHMPIARDNPRRAARSLLEAATHVREGTSVFVFPEGGRSPDGHFKEFKAGTFLLAIKAGVPVIPVTLNGTRAVLKMNSFHVHPGRVEMILHPPVSTDGMHSHSAGAFCVQVRDIIQSEFDESSAVSVR
jgi:1-acyl-sn-glycerol-3-phosphate acyltransferase